jgi:hypothetical protein
MGVRRVSLVRSRVKSRPQIQGSRVMLLLVVLVTSTSQAFAVFADSFSITGPALPIPGYTPAGDGEWISYVSPNADFMLVTHGSYPTRQVASRTLDSGTGLWGSRVDLLPLESHESSGGCLSPDGNSIYYYADGNQQSDIWRSRRTPDGWTAGEIVVSTAGADHSPMLAGNKLVFEHTVGSGYPLEIWQSDYDPITGLFSNTRTTNISGGDPWLSGDGSLLLFSSYNRPGGYGEGDLWYATWDDTVQAWTNVTNCGPNINTTGEEGADYIAEQAGLLFFNRDGVALQASVPEPSTLVLLGIGVISLLGYGWRRRRRTA